MSYRLTLLSLLLTFAASGQDPSPLTGLPSLYTVHIDQVSPSLAARYEHLVITQRQEREKLFEEHHLGLPPVYEISTTYGKYISLRPRAAYGDLDTVEHYPDELQQRIGAQLTPYSDTVHTLLTEHHSEIWKVDRAASYLPASFTADPSLLTYAHLRSEWVKPPLNATYDSVVALYRRGLDSLRYPLACIVWFSQYGSGATHYLWLARNFAEYVSAPSPEEVLTGVYGHAEGERLYQRWQECLSNADDIDADVRPDLSTPERGKSWLGIAK